VLGDCGVEIAQADFAGVYHIRKVVFKVLVPNTIIYPCHLQEMAGDELIQAVFVSQHLEFLFQLYLNLLF
jgi:hypothetical protein